MSGLSLYTIEQSLAELLEAREDLIEKRATVADGLPSQSADAGDLEADVNAELAEVEKALAEYFTREISKADGVHYAIRAYTDVLAQAEAEKQRITERVDRLKSTLKRIKQAACEAMEVLGKKRIDGTAGRYLLVKGNGGLAPLLVDGWDDEKKKWKPDARPVQPFNMLDVTVKMPLDCWQAILELDEVLGEKLVFKLVSETEPANSRIRAALAAECPKCGGSGSLLTDEERHGLATATGREFDCSSCNGTGKATVPGARLGERGKHLEIK